MTTPTMTTPTTLYETRALLEHAAAFARAGDHTGAVARAKSAVRAALGTEAREEASLALARFEGGERDWRDEVHARRAAFLARERAEAGIQDETAPSSARAVEPRGSRWRRFFSRRDEPTPAYA